MKQKQFSYNLNNNWQLDTTAKIYMVNTVTSGTSVIDYFIICFISVFTLLVLECWSRNIRCEQGHYHGSWCPSGWMRQDTNRHVIDSAEWICPCRRWKIWTTYAIRVLQKVHIVIRITLFRWLIFSRAAVFPLYFMRMWSKWTACLKLVKLYS